MFFWRFITAGRRAADFVYFSATVADSELLKLFFYLSGCHFPVMVEVNMVSIRILTLVLQDLL
jgi:hypothetical protein